MATQPPTGPDRIDPQVPDETPLTPVPPEQDEPGPSETEPVQPDVIEPGQGPDEV